METKSTALVVREPETQQAQISIYDRMTEPLGAAERLGGWIAKSKLIGVETPDQGIVVALSCMEERITPLEFARRYHVIKGRTSMRADYMQAAFQSAGGRVRWDRSDDEVCTVTVSHPEHCPEGFSVTVELAVLRTRKLTTEQYQRYPRQMLRARAASEAIRAVMPSINAGTYTPEELDDDPAAPASPASPAPAPSWSQPQAQPVIDARAEEKPPERDDRDDRAKKVIAHFKSLGVTQVELECFAGNFKDQIFAAAWDDETFIRFSAARKEIADSALEERYEVVQRLFRPGEDGAPPSEQS